MAATRWPASPLDGPSSGGAKLEFAIRPEDLTIAAGGLKATARVIEPLGAHTLVTSEVDGKLFRAVLDSDLKVAPGDELSLVPKPDRVRWFDPREHESRQLMSPPLRARRQGHRGAARK
jgi:multiple sugar transport system ATP-binding protein